MFTDQVQRSAASEDALSDEFFEQMHDLVSQRVSPHRLEHIEGVAQTASDLARIYGVDARKARLAGILHDWDKSYRSKEIRARARELGIEDEVGQWVVENLPQVLHGPTAACELATLFPNIPAEVISAIRKHTTASVDMTDLDKVIYIADAIEPGRNFAEVDQMRGLVGTVSLDELYFQIYKFWTLALLKRDCVLHPDTMLIWNTLTEEKSRKRQERFE